MIKSPTFYLLGRSNVFDELADFAAAVSAGEVGELQNVLETLAVGDRLRKALLLVLKNELINVQLQSKLSRDVDSKSAKCQHEYYLMEQLKGIEKEVGMESDGKVRLIETLKARAEQFAMPEPVKRVLKGISLSSRISNLRNPRRTSHASTSTGSRRFPGVNAHARTTRSDTPRRF